jgi:drug/metabolite transporter (DMT)-like permease
MTAPSPAPAAPPAAASEARFGGFDAVLYAITVFAWSTSWIAMKAQVATVAPEVSLLWRFLISAVVMWIWVTIRGDRMRFPPSAHLGFAGLGFFIFSMNFDLFYHGAKSLPSGLLSVVFSLASVINLLMGFLVFRQKISGRVFFGGLLGFSGVAAMFWPKIAGTDFDTGAAVGLALCVAGTTFFCIGNMLSSAIQRRGVPVLAATAWGMVWACGFLLAACLIQGLPLTFERTTPYVVSLLWLAIVSSVAAFWAYLTLLGRIGAARAGYATVMFPVFALAISTVFEDYRWTLPAVIGLGLVLAGNLFVLRR